MSDRRTEILETAITMIANDGYSSLTMRALAREVVIKLGALQYHFKTAEELTRAVVGYISDSYDQSFSTLDLDETSPDLKTLVTFIMDDKAGDELLGDKLWPQLWAMQQIEPLVSELVEDIYHRYLKILQKALKKAGSTAPKAEALFLMSALEGSTIFLGSGRRWARDAKAVEKFTLEYIESRYES